MAPAPCNDPQQYRKGEGGKPASECGYVEEELERCEGEREGLAFENRGDFEAVKEVSGVVYWNILVINLW